MAEQISPQTGFELGTARSAGQCSTHGATVSGNLDSDPL